MKDVRKLAAIVFTDIVGYTSMMEENEQKALNILREKRIILEKLIAEFKGNHLKEIGDGDLMMFDSATSAVNFATKVHEATLGNGLFKITAAVHLGDIVIENNDVFGSGVNIASRLHVLAKPGQTIISDSIYMLIRNKPEFEITSLGQKKVKGITDKIEVYSIGDTQEEQEENIEEKISIVKDLISRRVPQFIGIYFAISWGIIQFINWLVDRYMLSPYLIDLCFAISISMIPSILILSYFHGKPGKDRWTKVEKVAIPLNAIISVIVLFIVFYPKDLGATTKEIKMIDDDGNELIKTIVKSEFKKNIVIFPFENEEINKDAYNWLINGIPHVLCIDLSQDSYIVNHTDYALGYLLETNQSIYEPIPIKEKKSLSDRVHAEYFISGQYIVSENNLKISFDVYETSNLKIIYSKKYQAPITDLFNMIDQISLDLRIGLEIPSSYIDSNQDVPVNEIFTNSIEAFSYYTKGINAWTYDNNITEADENFKKVFQFDNSFAYAHFYYSHFCVTMLGDAELRAYHVKQANKFSSKLPGLYPYLIKLVLLDLSGKSEDQQKKKEVLGMMRKYFPDNLMIYQMSVQFSFMENDFKSMIKWYRKILEINPAEKDYLLRIGDVYKDHLADFDNALIYYNKYLELFPNKPILHETLASLYSDQFDYKKADEHFLQAEMLGSKGMSFKLDYLLNTGNLNKWNLDSYMDKYHDLLIDASQIDSIEIYEYVTWSTAAYGKMYLSVDYHYKLKDLLNKARGFVQSYFRVNTELSYLYAKLGESEKARLIIDEGKKLPVPLDKIYLTLERLYYESSNQIDKLEDVLQPSLEGERSAGIPGLFAANHLMCNGRIYAESKDYDKAIDFFKQSIEKDPTYKNLESYIYLAKTYMILNNESDAEKVFIQVYKHIGEENAWLNYEYAIFLEGIGKIDKSRDYITKAYNKYKDADPELELAQNIWEKYKEMNLR